jgi:hypothetical protein
VLLEQRRNQFDTGIQVALTVQVAVLEVSLLSHFLQAQMVTTELDESASQIATGLKHHISSGIIWL